MGVIPSTCTCLYILAYLTFFEGVCRQNGFARMSNKWGIADAWYAVDMAEGSVKNTRIITQPSIQALKAVKAVVVVDDEQEPTGQIVLATVLAVLVLGLLLLALMSTFKPINQNYQGF